MGFDEASGNVGSLNTTGAAATLGATMKVSMLKRPMNLPYPLPSLLVSISPWYQARPNGAFGTWITNKSKSVLGGRPETVTSIISTGPTDSIFARPWAFFKTPADSPVEGI